LRFIRVVECFFFKKSFPVLEAITISSFVINITMLNKESYYDILEADEDSTASEIRREDKELLPKVHPDKDHHAPPAQKKELAEAFQRINQAHEVFRDHREEYDWEQQFYGAISHSKKPSQESGFSDYGKANKENSQSSFAKQNAASSGGTQKEENSKYTNASAWAEKTDSKQQSSEKPQMSLKTPPRYRDQELVFGTRADGQPCKRCQMYGKFCFQHTYQDPRLYKERFGTRADGQPCKRCQMHGKFCFHHVHQDPSFHAQDSKHGESTNGHRNAKKAPGQSHARFGTRADGQPCRRCEMQGKYCFQHTHQDPQFV
jgi:curved DNA-binding protein CbpA